MTGWAEFALAWALFVASHFLPRLGQLRERLIARVGRRVYFSVYGFLSLALLAWLIVAAGRAPYVPLWPQTEWTRWVPNILMPLAAVLAACGIGVATPFTLGGRRGTGFDPSAAGFADICRHPLLMALGLWALAHLVPNGDLAHVVLFGGFAAMAFGAMPLFDMRARRALGAEVAGLYFRRTSLLSLKPLTDSHWRRAMGRSLAGRALVGLAIWAVAFHLHAPVIGASPLPG